MVSGVIFIEAGVVRLCKLIRYTIPDIEEHIEQKWTKLVHYTDSTAVDSIKLLTKPVVFL